MCPNNCLRTTGFPDCGLQPSFAETALDATGQRSSFASVWNLPSLQIILLKWSECWNLTNTNQQNDILKWTPGALKTPNYEMQHNIKCEHKLNSTKNAASGKNCLIQPCYIPIADDKLYTNTVPSGNHYWMEHYTFYQFLTLLDWSYYTIWIYRLLSLLVVLAAAT